MKEARDVDLNWRRLTEGQVGPVSTRAIGATDALAVYDDGADTHCRVDERDAPLADVVSVHDDILEEKEDNHCSRQDVTEDGQEGGHARNEARSLVEGALRIVLGRREAHARGAGDDQDGLQVGEGLKKVPDDLDVHGRHDGANDVAVLAGMDAEDSRREHPRQGCGTDGLNDALRKMTRKQLT